MIICYWLQELNMTMTIENRVKIVVITVIVLANMKAKSCLVMSLKINLWTQIHCLLLAIQVAI